MSLIIFKQATRLNLNIGPEDEAMLDGSSKQVDLIGSQAETAITPINNSTVQMFSNAYKTDAAADLANNNLILNDFRGLRSNNENREIYDSMSNLFVSADTFVDFVTEMKKLHNDILTELAILQRRIADKYEPIRQAFVRDAEATDPHDKKFLKNVLQSANLNRYIKACDDKIKEMGELNKKLKDVFKFAIERKNLVSVMGAHDNRDALDNFDSEIDEFSKRVADEQENLLKYLPQKLEVESEHNMSTLKINQINSLIRQQEAYQQELNNTKKELQTAKQANETKKREILDKANDPNRLKKTLDEEEATFKTFEDEYAKSVLDINKKTNELSQSISEIKEVNKNYHLVFILDESGSMCSYFQALKDSVRRVVEDRRKQPVVRDKVSVIRFNDSARTEILNQDVTEDVNLSDYKGGGTRFIPALQKLEELLEEINVDLFIPIVFFLSDGFGESRDNVLVKCRQVRDKYARMDILFFCIGYGDDADEDTLSGMATVFNNSKSILHIGNEMCKLYHSVHTQGELLKAFTVYEKLFNYQKNILRTRADAFQGLLKQKEEMNKQTFASLKKMSEMRHEMIQREVEGANTQSDHIEDVNKRLDKSIVQLDAQIKDSHDICTALLDERGQVEKRLASKAGEKTVLEAKCKVYEADLEKYRGFLDQAKMKKNQQIDKLLNDLEKNRESDYQRCLENFKNLNLTVPNTETFKRMHAQFTANYYKYKRLYDNVQVKSNEIMNEFRKLVENIRSVEEDLLEFQDLTQENLQSKIWGLVVYYFENKFSIVSRLIEQKGTEISDADVLEAICHKRMKMGVSHRKALELLLEVESPQTLFAKLEKKHDYADRFVDKYLSAKIGHLKKPKELELENLIGDTSMDISAKESKIAEVKKRIKEIEASRERFENYSSSIQTVLEDLNEARQLVREQFLVSFFDHRLNNRLATVSQSIEPEIKQLQIGYKNSTKA